MMLISELVQALHIEFPIIDLGKLYFFLGIEVTHTEKGLLLTQHKYIFNLLQHKNMSFAKPMKTPMATSVKLTLHSGNLFENPTLHISTVGSLQYLSFTSHDLAFEVSKVCQYMHSSRLPH